MTVDFKKQYYGILFYKGNLDSGNSYVHGSFNPEKNKDSFIRFDSLDSLVKELNHPSVLRFARANNIEVAQAVLLEEGEKPDEYKHVVKTYELKFVEMIFP